MSPAGPTLAVRARRLRDRSARAGKGSPLVLWAALLSLLAFFGWRAFEAYESTRTHFTVIGIDGEPAPELQLTFFPERFAFTAPSPPDPIGSSTLPAGGSLSVGAELVPDRAMVRYSGPGVGTGLAFAQTGRPTQIELRPPSSLWGRVVEQRRYWWFGWRSGQVPVVSAEVIAMGGGEHGIPLGTAKTAADGTFEIDGVAVGRASLALRVLSQGRAIVHANVDLPAMAKNGQTIELEPAAPRRGRLACPAGVEPRELTVLARGLPGVEARPDAEGAFVLHHIPEGFEPRLLVVGLAEGFVAAPAIAHIGVTPTVEIVRAAFVTGTVVDAVTGAALADCLVWSGETEAVRADGSGRFELGPIVPGRIDVTAQHTIQPKNRRPKHRSGSTTVTVQPGELRKAIVIEIP